MWCPAYKQGCWFVYTCILALVSAICFSVYSSKYMANLFRSNVTSTNRKLEKLADSIWPKNGENEDRIELQFKLGYILAEHRRRGVEPGDAEKKIILVTDAHYLYETVADGDVMFRKCPQANCHITTDIQRYMRTAHAIILIRFDPDYIRKFQPKPKQQVTLLGRIACTECKDVYLSVC